MFRAIMKAFQIGGDIKSVGKGRYHKRIMGRAVRRPINRKINRWFR